MSNDESSKMITARMSLRLENMLARSHYSNEQRIRLLKLERQIRTLAEKLEVDLI